MPYADKNKQKEYSRRHYAENKEKYLSNNKARRNDLKDFIRKVKEATPCKDCKHNFPHYVMDFDHLGDKLGLIKNFVHNNNRSGLLKELRKCEIVCSNCHRQRTFMRLQKK